MINYQANGELIGCVKINENRYVILVEWAHQYVVSQYIDGATEWQAGHYRDDFHNALKSFNLLVEASLGLHAINRDVSE